MSASPDELFNGDETRSESPCSEFEAQRDHEIHEDDAVNPWTWATTVTYTEIHSVGIGFLSMFTAIVMLPVDPVTGQALLGVAATILAGTVWVRKVPNGTVRRWLCKEPHYVWLGAVFGTLLSLPLHFYLQVIAV